MEDESAHTDPLNEYGTLLRNALLEYIRGSLADGERCGERDGALCVTHIDDSPIGGGTSRLHCDEAEKVQGVFSRAYAECARLFFISQELIMKFVC